MGILHIFVLLVVSSAGTSAQDCPYTCSTLGTQANPCDCSKYINCGNQGPVYLDCAEGTLFDPTLVACSSACDFDCAIPNVKPPGCPVAKVCKSRPKCGKNAGTCMAKSEPCSGFIVQRGCKGKDCKCCGTKRPLRCPTYKRCKKSGGKCQPIANTCEGKMVNHKCRGTRCGCCIPE